MSAWLGQLAVHVVGALAWFGMRLLPTRRLAVVRGYPDSEGNALHTLAALADRYPGEIHWLVSDPQSAGLLEPTGVAPERITVVPRTSLRALLSELTAEVKFFTHGLITAVPPPASRLVVNLWHGDGPKHTYDVPRGHATAIVASTELFGHLKGAMFGIPPERVAVVGNPRVADLTAPVDRERLLTALGLPTDSLLVLWMPTYRSGGDEMGRAWADGVGLSGQLSGQIRPPAGVQLVVKPHPMDRDDYTAFGARVIINADLKAAGTNTYQFMAAADALISDASSTWTDYLLLDRPIGFLMPDLRAYEGARGYNVPDVTKVLPGPLLEEFADVQGFLEAIVDGRFERPSEHPAYGELGLCLNPRPADDLLDWLDDYCIRTGRRPLFGRGARPERTGPGQPSGQRPTSSA